MRLNRKARAAIGAIAVLSLVAVGPAAGHQRVVQPGDTLSAIAAQEGISLADLATANAISDTDAIVIGQTLTIPHATSTHTVQPGETLSIIAAQYGVSVAALIDSNGLADPNVIPIGATLQVPGTGGAASAAAAAPTTTSANHVVAAGESLSSIAAQYGVTVSSLSAANGISNPDIVVIGTSLAISGAAAAPSSTAASTAATHTVASGETLSMIAAQYGVTTSSIAGQNGITDPNVVVVGSQLAIPGGASAAAAPGPSGGSWTASRIDYWASVYGAPAALMKALTWFESGWNNGVVSSAGAIGIGQLMPDTVTFVSSTLIGLPLDPYDSDQNIQMSVRFMRYLLDQTGWDLTLAVAAYYQGLGAVRLYGVYPSSWSYVNGILGLSARF